MKVFRNLFGEGDKIHVDEIAVAPGILLGSSVLPDRGSAPLSGDFNSLEHGFYRANISNMTNAPEALYRYGIVLSLISLHGYGLQIYFEDSLDRDIYWRCRYGTGTWRAWVKI